MLFRQKNFDFRGTDLEIEDFESGALVGLSVVDSNSPDLDPTRKEKSKIFAKACKRADSALRSVVWLDARDFHSWGTIWEDHRGIQFSSSLGISVLGLSSEKPGVRFHRASQIIIEKLSVDLSFTPTATVEVWVRLNSLPPSPVRIAGSGSRTIEVVQSINISLVTIRIDGQSVVDVDAVDMLEDYNHIVGVWDISGAITLYFNSIPFAVKPGTGAPAESSAFFVGSSPAQAGFDGWISTLSIFDQALGRHEVTSLFGMLFYFRLLHTPCLFPRNVSR